MAKNRLRSRTDFAEYCLRKLGKPVIVINIAPSQIEDAIDDALDKFWEYHADGSTQMFYKHQITQENVDSRSFKLPDNLLNVVRVLSVGGSVNGIANYNNLQYVAYFSDVISRIPAGGIGTYALNMSYLQLINDMFNPERCIEYNKHQGILHIQSDVPMVVGDYIVYEAVAINDPEEFEETWNNWFLKNYATALMKKQWGINLSKYSNVPLPSGLTMNGDQIRDAGVAEIADLEDRLRDEFSLPPDFFMG